MNNRQKDTIVTLLKIQLRPRSLLAIRLHLSIFPGQAADCIIILLYCCIVILLHCRIVFFFYLPFAVFLDIEGQKQKDEKSSEQ